MVNFGEQILASQYVPWALHYIDYNHLKQVLDDEYKDKESRSHSSLSTRQSGASPEFLSQLYAQTEKVAFFVFRQQGMIAAELAECRKEFLKGINVTDLNELVLLEEKYVAAGLSLLRLVKFVELNVTGFRKILKKHDKMAHSRLSLAYLALRWDSDGAMPLSRALSFHSRFCEGNQTNLAVLGNNLLQPLLNNGCVAALAAAYAAGIEELRLYWRQYELNNDTGEKLESNRNILSAPNLVDLGDQTTSPTNRSHGDLISMMDKAEVLGRRTMNPGQLLLQIHAARGRLQSTNEFVRLVGASLMVPAISEDDEMASKTGTVQRPSELSNTLNLLSTFFYMGNYYIVAPTSASYADRVGSESSIASMIIGMTSVAALMSTLLYSWWTSYSYKSALIFATTCAAVGNILYGAGLPCNSLSLVMFGRLTTGFGSARSINRRYIADSYPQAERTAASAAFVTASAMGMAAGPAMAAVLHVATEGSTTVYWQSENAPGWFMATVWVVFLVLLIFKFEDPPRRNSSSSSSNNNNQQQEGTMAEKKPLLGNGVDGEEEEETSEGSICDIPVIVTLIVYMVLKMVLEAVTSSEANLTGLYFGWEAGQAGVHLTILALLIIPVNYCIAYFSRQYFDREMIIALLLAIFLGCVIILQYQSDPENYTLAQYLIGSAMCFCCASALEGPNMSLLSKVIPKKWSVGIVNVGLLATESGTLGRVIGDILLAAVGSHGLDSLLNRAFGAYAVVVLGALLMTLATYRWLVEPPEKDD